MTSVGVRELKTHLSRYLRDVQEGETILVTDRGKPVARLVPAGIPDDIAALIASGRVTWSGRRFEAPAHAVKPRPGAPLASDLISEDRD